jgi:hypothetical protein
MILLQCNMFKQKRIPSGFNKEEVVNAFKQVLFDKWCVEPVKKSNTKYKHFPMPEDYVPFPCWEIWVAIGPPAGEACNPILKVEFIAPPSASFLAANGADNDKPPAALVALNDNAQSGRFMSRSAIQKATSNKQAVSTPTSSSSIHGERLERDRMNDKIKQLQWLSVSEFLSESEKKAYRRQIHDIMVANCESPSSLSSMTMSPLAPTTPSTTPASVAVFAGSKSVSSSNAPEGLPGAALTQSLAESRAATQLLDDRFSTVVCTLNFGGEPGKSSIGDSPALVDEVPGFDRLLNFADYQKWLKGTHGLQAMFVPSNGACLFESVLRCIQALVACSQGAEYAPLPFLSMYFLDWSIVTASSFRKVILTLMKSVIYCPFPALEKLGYTSFNDIISCEGEEHGIVDHDLRDTGNPPQKFERVDDYFKLMAPDTAYGNLSALVAIAVFCDVQIHVWIRCEDLPEIYGAETSTHYISLLKEDRMSHYDALTWTDSKCHTFAARSRASFFRDEVDFRDRQRRQMAAQKAAAERLQQELKMADDKRQSREAAQRRSLAEALTAAAADASASPAKDVVACVSTSEEAEYRNFVERNDGAIPAASASAFSAPTSMDADSKTAAASAAAASAASQSSQMKSAAIPAAFVSLAQNEAAAVSAVAASAASQPSKKKRSSASSKVPTTITTLGMATGAALIKSKLVEHSDAAVQKWARSPTPGCLPPLMATPQHTVRNQPTTDEVFLKAVLSADISERCAAAGRVMMEAIGALTDAAPVAAASAAASAAPQQKRSRSKSPRDLGKDYEKEIKKCEKLYSDWHKAKESFDTLKWDRDIYRGHTTHGKGIFAKTRIHKGTCVALYWGNLVDHKGMIHVRIHHHHHHRHLQLQTSLTRPPPPLLAVHMRDDKATPRGTPRHEKKIFPSSFSYPRPKRRQFVS